MRIASGVTDQYCYFVAVDSTDFTTRETGLSSFTVYRSRNGGAAAAMTTPTINEVDATNMPGVYELLLDEDMTLDAGDDTQEMVFHITATGMAPVTRTIELYRPKITAGQTLTVGSGNANAAVQSIAANAITATSIASGAITSAKIAASAIGASQIATDAITAAKIAANAIGASELAADAVTEIQSGLATSASIAALNNLSAADVNAQVDSALLDYDGPTKAEMDGAFAALNDLSAADVAGELATYDGPTNTEMVAAFTEIKGATFSGATDSLEAIRDRGDAAWTTGAGGTAPTVGEIADAVWTEALADHSGTAGSTAEALDGAGGLDAAGVRAAVGLASASLDTQLGTIDSNVDAVLVDTGTTIPGVVAALNDLSSADVRSAVGLASANLDTQLGTIDTNVDSVLTDTGTTLPATLSTIEGKVDTVDGVADAILVDTGTTIPASLDALPTATENADALLNRDMSAVSVTNARSPINAMRFLRNKYEVVGTTLTVFEEDDSTAAWTAALTANASADPITGSDPA